MNRKLVAMRDGMAGAGSTAKRTSLLLNELEQCEEEKRQLHDKIQKNIEETIFPLVEKLKGTLSQTERELFEISQKLIAHSQIIPGPGVAGIQCDGFSIDVNSLFVPTHLAI